MARHVLTIDPSYQATEWHLEDAIRELIANAIDSEKRQESKMSLGYSVRNKTLSIESLGIKLPLKVLLMGQSTARDVEDNIGLFGEGLAMALKTLALYEGNGKLEGLTIENDDEKWTPKLEFDTTWDSWVTAIHTRVIKPRNSFKVIINGISFEQWEDIQRLFLDLDPEFNLDEVVKPAQWGYDRILTGESFAGSVYVKGVFVKSYPDLRYGYDLDMKLNRDRKMVDEWDLRNQLQRLLASAMEIAPDKFKRDLVDMITSGENFEVSRAHWALTQNSTVAEAVTSSFEDKHGEDAIPVANMSESRRANDLGKKGVVVGSAVKEIIETRKGGFEERIKKAEMRSKKTYSWGELTPEEQENIENCVGLCNRAHIVSGDVLDTLKIVDFHDDKMLGRYARGTGEIMLARRICGEFKETITTLVHEIGHQIIGADDGSKTHEDAQMGAWADIVSSLVAPR